MNPQQGLLVHTNYPPTIFDQRRYYEDPILRQMADNPDKYGGELDDSTGYMEAA
jgi:hypothetical protein